MELSASIPNVRILKNDVNSGVSFTRNRCIRNALGKYIWFVDPDDMLYPGCVNLVLEAAEKNTADIVLGNYIRIAEDDKNEYEPLQTVQIKHKDTQYLPIDKDGRQMCAIWAGPFSREFLIRNKLFFNEKMIAQEDSLFYYEFRLRTTNIWKFNEPCYLYRQRNSSVMHSKSQENKEKYYYSMCEMYKAYKEHLISGDYLNIDEISYKIQHMRVNLATTLCYNADTSFVHKELIRLKKEKIYPYPFSLQYARKNPNIRIKIVETILPFELNFWILHIFCKIRFFLSNK